MTPTQTAFWTAARRAIQNAPERFTPGKYPCPLCSKNPTDKRLKIDADDTGGVRFTCYGQCDRNELRLRLGVRSWSALKGDRAAEHGKFIGEFTYVDEQGIPLFQVVRYEKGEAPRFKIRNDAGDWTLAPRGWKRPHMLYRANSLVEAIANEETVYLTASEMDADAIRSHGGIGTATHDAPGKGGFRVEYVDALRGAYVRVVAVKHEAGRQRARLIANALTGSVADVSIVEPAVVKHGATVHDHLAAEFTLDELTPLTYEPTSDGHVPDVHVEPGDGVSILNAIEQALTDYVVFANPHQVVALVLWVAHSHAIDIAFTTPYIRVNSAEPESGKSRTLEVAECLVARPWRITAPTEAVIYRKIEKEHPTTLFDEIDTVWGERENHATLTGILNDGYRRGGKVARCVGQDQEVRDFEVFGTKMLVGLTGNLAKALLSRCIVIRLQRYKKGERPREFEIPESPNELRPIHDRLAAWIKLMKEDIARVKPERPEVLSGRQRDCWKPLLAIAEVVGGPWPEKARNAAIALHGHDVAAEPTTGVLLLKHIRWIFNKERKKNKEFDRIPTDTLLTTLCNRTDGPWAELWEKDLKFDIRIPAAKLAAMLKHYEIEPKPFKPIGGGTTARGYRFGHFADAFERYLSSFPAEEPSEEPKE